MDCFICQLLGQSCTVSTPYCLEVNACHSACSSDSQCTASEFLHTSCQPVAACVTSMASCPTPTSPMNSVNSFVRKDSWSLSLTSTGHQVLNIPNPPEVTSGDVLAVVHNSGEGRLLTLTNDPAHIKDISTTLATAGPMLISGTFDLSGGVEVSQDVEHMVRGFVVTPGEVTLYHKYVTAGLYEVNFTAFEASIPGMSAFSNVTVQQYIDYITITVPEYGCAGENFSCTVQHHKGEYNRFQVIYPAFPSLLYISMETANNTVNVGCNVYSL